VLGLRQQVKVLERQIKRARWQPEYRLILSVLRERLPRTAWAGLLVSRRRCWVGSRIGPPEVGGLPGSSESGTSAAR
jgi:hypothetical protein